MNESFEKKFAPRIAAIAVKDARHAIFVRQAVRDGHWRVMCQAGDTVAAEKAALAVLERFEAGLDAHLAKQRQQRQEEAAREQWQRAEYARARARAEAREHPMAPAAIVSAIESAGHRIRLRDLAIEIAPGSGLAVELEAQVTERAAVVGDHLRAREDWKVIAIVPAEDAAA